MPAIELNNVTKRYERSGLFRGETVTALQNVDLTVNNGEIYGFLGPNGAGKSTTIDLLLRYTLPTEGSIHVLGEDATDESTDIREKVGVLPDGYGPIGQRTGRQHVKYAIEIKGSDDDPDVLLERVGMLGPDKYPVEDYSKGMTQRIMLAVALVGKPDLLILDEPSTGLDPNGARRMRQIVVEENERGATVFFSSHILEQVEAVCDRVCILDGGSVATVDSIENLRDSIGYTAEITAELSDIPSSLVNQLDSLENVSDIKINGRTIVITCSNDSKSTVVSKLYNSNTEVLNISTDEASLDDLFADYTGGVKQ